MTRTHISKTDLSHRAGEIVERVQHGELAVVESDGQEQVVLLDAMDYRLLRALAACATGDPQAEMTPETAAIRDYLDERISLSRAAELLRLSRFDLMERFQRLEVPLRLGPASFEEAQAEVAALRDYA
jgi:prevent-host-death family protein